MSTDERSIARVKRIARALALLVALRARPGGRAVIASRPPHRRRSRTSIPRERVVPVEPPGRDGGRGAAAAGRGVRLRLHGGVRRADETNTQLLGVAIGGALALLAAAAIVAGKLVVPQETAVEERGPLLVEEQAEEVVEMIEAGGEGISRRALLTGAGGVAGAALVTAAATPIASLGPTLDGIHQTPWHARRAPGRRPGQPVPRRRDPDRQLLHRAARGRRPGAARRRAARRPAAAVLSSTCPPARRSWAPDGIVAYSKICPHAGCAISLYRYPTYAPTSAAARRSPARATTRRSRPARAGG